MKARVLIVDDKDELARSLAEGLREHGFDATGCSDPDVALAEVKRGAHDALVTDLAASYCIAEDEIEGEVGAFLDQLGRAGLLASG